MKNLLAAHSPEEVLLTPPAPGRGRHDLPKALAALRPGIVLANWCLFESYPYCLWSLEALLLTKQPPIGTGCFWPAALERRAILRLTLIKLKFIISLIKNKI